MAVVLSPSPLFIELNKILTVSGLGDVMSPSRAAIPALIAPSITAALGSLVIDAPKVGLMTRLARTGALAQRSATAAIAGSPIQRRARSKTLWPPLLAFSDPSFDAMKLRL